MPRYSISTSSYSHYIPVREQYSQCKAITKNGTQCKFSAKFGDYCGIHQKTMSKKFKQDIIKNQIYVNGTSNDYIFLQNIAEKYDKLKDINKKKEYYQKTIQNILNFYDDNDVKKVFTLACCYRELEISKKAYEIFLKVNYYPEKEKYLTNKEIEEMKFYIITINKNKLYKLSKEKEQIEKKVSKKNTYFYLGLISFSFLLLIATSYCSQISSNYRLNLLIITILVSSSSILWYLLYRLLKCFNKNNDIIISNINYKIDEFKNKWKGLI